MAKKDDVSGSDVLESAAMVDEIAKKRKLWKLTALGFWSIVLYLLQGWLSVAVLGYLWIGYEVVSNSPEFSATDPQYYTALLCWLPMLVLGGIWRIVERVVEWLV